MKRRDNVIAATVFAAAAVMFTWPLAAHFGSTVPTGSRPPTVALFGLYTVEWTAHVAQGGGSYWNAPMFHPHEGTLAWSEPQPATALLVWLVSFVTGTVAAYNLVLLCYLAMTGFAGYLLARQLTGDVVAAIWAGLWLTAGAYPMQQLNVLQLLAAAFPVGCLAAILALARDPRRDTAVCAGVSYLMTWLTCIQFGFFLTLLLPFVVVPLFWRAFDLRRVATIVVPLASGLLLALPVLLQQRNRLERMGFERFLEDVQGAYTPLDLLIPARGHWFSSRILHLDAGHYPFDIGLVFLLAFIATALLGGMRLRSAERSYVAVGAMSVAALLLGFGPNLGIPYTWLRNVVPGLAGVRTPSRFGVFAVVGVAALAAVAFGFLRGRMTRGGRRLAVTVIGFGLLLVEMWAVPIRVVDPSIGLDDHRGTIEWIREHGAGEPMAEIPFARGSGETELAREVQAARRALRSGSPTVNGYSSYFPDTFLQLRDAVERDLAGRGRRYLRALGVRHVLVHRHDLADAGFLAALGGRVVYDDGRDTIVRLAGDPAPPPVAPTTASRRFPTPPERGTILGVPIDPSSGRAQIVAARPDSRLQLVWTDRSGSTKTGELSLRGAVLVDAGKPWLHVLVQSPPPGGRPGRGVLFAEERLPKVP